LKPLSGVWKRWFDLHTFSMHEALLTRSLENQHVQCRVCQRQCTIAPGKCGFCKTRKNIDGKLYSLIYGRVSSIRVSPIEIKPLFHYYPGSKWLSLGSLGCNFLCPGCQNWEIAHAEAEQDLSATRFLDPEKLVQAALDKNCKGISWTYNEPTVWFEYTLDAAKLAKKRGLLANYVTNGSITPEALDLIGAYLDAYRVDLKGFSDQAYRRLTPMVALQDILAVIQRAKDKWGMHVEIITNLIPDINDGEQELGEMARWIFRVLGPDTPWHVTRFIPHLKLAHLSPTPIAKLERVRKIGMEQGLRYVYLGNVQGHPSENSYCFGCGRLIVKRLNYRIVEYQIRGNRCRFCGEKIAGSFK
jgi:pyruvate formate lyase activating enzyme